MGENFYEEIKKIKIKEKVSDLKKILLEKFKGQVVTYTEVKDFVLEETSIFKITYNKQNIKTIRKRE